MILSNGEYKRHYWATVFKSEKGGRFLLVIEEKRKGLKDQMTNKPFDELITKGKLFQNHH